MWTELGLGIQAQQRAAPLCSGAREPAAQAAPTATVAPLSGPDRGREVPIGATGLLIGRASAADLVVDEPTVSARHARIARDDEAGFWIVDLTSTHGTFIGRRRVWRALLSPDRAVRLGPLVQLRFRIADPVEEARQRARYATAIGDPVTGRYGRRYFVERLAGELCHAISQGAGLALLLVDVDDIGRIYRQQGFVAGDETLRSVADRIAAAAEPADVIARLAGDTLAVLAPGSDSAHAAKLARRIRGGLVLRHVETGSEREAVTVSIGAVGLHELGVDSCPAADLLAIARARLDEAKRCGGNRIVATN